MPRRYATGRVGNEACRGVREISHDVSEGEEEQVEPRVEMREDNANPPRFATHMYSRIPDFSSLHRSRA